MLSSLWVEHAILDPESRRMQLLLRIRNSPGALTLRATRGLLTTTRYAEPTSL